MNQNSCIIKASVVRREPSELARARVAQDTRQRKAALALIQREKTERDARAFATVQEDLQATRSLPSEAPMATWDPPRDESRAVALGAGRLVLTLLAVMTSFIGGMVVGRLA
jgi:hypothetical protein